jgi:hypothetical protein
MLGRLLQRTLTAVRPRPARSGAGECGPLLGRVIADLESLNHRTEQDFLAIGGKLMGFVTGARQLSSDMTALEELFGRQDGNASQVLNRVLERSKQIEDRAQTGDQALTGVCDSARQIGRTFRGFEDIVSVFRVLGSLTRIETARLGNAGHDFGSLAEEATALTKNIESSGQRILQASLALHQQMQSALGKVTALRASELQQLPALIEDVVTSQGSLEDRHRQAIEVFLRQASEYQKVSAAFEDLITAIQFHDITRQQVEHVSDSLQRLKAEFQGGSRSAAALDARAVLTLQASQLSNAEQVFASSIGRIEQDLDGIAGRVREMAETTKALVGSSAEGKDSSFLQMEGRFTAILRVVGTCAQAEAESQSVLTELEETVKQLWGAVGEIREIEIRIRRMAINATVKAVQIGSAGNALNVIADVMQRLALDATGITDTVARDLEAIGDAANRLSGSSGSTPAGKDPGTDDVLSEMRAAMLELHSSSEASFSRLNQITSTSALLGDEIHSVRAEFSAGALFSEAVQSARSTLEQIGRQAGPGIADGGKAPAVALGDFAAHYTMQAEREVHEAVAAGTEAGQPASLEASAAAAGDDDLGANVELF